MTLSPTALEEAENALYPILNDDDWTGDRPKIIATAAITAYLAQAEKEGWVVNTPSASADGFSVKLCRNRLA